MTEYACGCCEGIKILTPQSTANRPGLSALAYRVGTHATFLETMKARLASLHLEVPMEAGSQATHRIYPLQALTTRETGDPAIAFLDAWATVADVLTFYQERIANEGYLLTATERRSILELARLVDYRLRPGVAASVFLAFELDEGYRVEIPAGTRAQSIPRPGELPQTFETAESLVARAAWNKLKPRLTRPQEITSSATTLYFKGISTNLAANDRLLAHFADTDTQHVFVVKDVEADPAADRTKVTLQTLTPQITQPQAALAFAAPIGTSLPLALHAAALRDFAGNLAAVGDVSVDDLELVVRNVTSSMLTAFSVLISMSPSAVKSQAVQENLAALSQAKGIVAAALSRTPGNSILHERLSELQTWLDRAIAILDTDRASQPAAPTTLGNLTRLLSVRPTAATIPPRNSLYLSPDDLKASYSSGSDLGLRLLTTMRPELASVLYNAWRNAMVSDPSSAKVYALRTEAAVFGHNAPPKPIHRANGTVAGYKEWDLKEDIASSTEDFGIEIDFDPPSDLHPDTWQYALTVSLGQDVLARGSTELTKEQFSIELQDEVFAVNVVEAQHEPQLVFTMRVELRQRSIGLRIQRDLDGVQSVVEDGSDRTTVAISETHRRYIYPETEYFVHDIRVEGQIRTPAVYRETESKTRVSLDSQYPKVIPAIQADDGLEGSWIVIERPHGTDTRQIISPVISVRQRSRTDYGLTGRVSEIEIQATESGGWIDPETETLEIIRGTTVYTQSELLELAEAPIETVEIAAPIGGKRIELAELYDGLEPGRWLVVSGERTDIPGSSGVMASELVMLATVEQVRESSVPDDKAVSTLILANELAHTYKRDTVTIYGNVVKSTHGETRQEALGSGDGTQARQRFTLKQKPLTHVAAHTATGTDTTLEVRVDDVRWREADNLFFLGLNDRQYITRTDDEQNTTVIFGDGRNGARLPTGVENVKAVYRSGIGQPGNVAAEQISLLATRPLGVKGVINPIAASGAADRESKDQARGNVPLALLALDRLVSVQDYADFARTFAGIGKAHAARLSNGRQQVVHLTIAGAGDIPIDKTSDLYRNLGRALRLHGDPFQPIEIDLRELVVLIMKARVRLLPDHNWETVAPKVRATLLDAFSFEKRELGQDVLASEVISVIQQLHTIDYVDLDLLGAVSESDAEDPDQLAQKLENLVNARHCASGKANGQDRDCQPQARIQARLPSFDPDTRAIQRAQLAILSSQVPETLILEVIP